MIMIVLKATEKIRATARVAPTIIYLALICCYVCGCQSPLWETLKQPITQQRQAQLEEESRIQKSFSAAGFIVHLPSSANKRPRYICETKYFEIWFAAVDAEHALNLASEADSIYERVKEWFQFGLPYKVKVKLEPTGSLHSEMMQKQNSSGRATGANVFHLNSAANPSQHTFAHELGHLFFFRMLSVKAVPWWLNEGIPDYVATENRSDIEYAKQFIWQVGYQEELLHLNKLPISNLPRWQSYRAALSFLLFLHHKYGEEKLRAMIKGYVRSPISVTIEDAIFLVHGKTLAELESEWRTAAKIGNGQ